MYERVRMCVFMWGPVRGAYYVRNGLRKGGRVEGLPFCHVY